MLGFIPPFTGCYLASYQSSTWGLSKKCSCVLNAAPTLDGGQACSWKPYLNRKDKQKIEIGRMSNTVWISVHLVKGFQIGIFVSVLNCKKIKNPVLYVCVYMHTQSIFLLYIYKRNVRACYRAAESLHFLKSSLFVAFLWTHFKIRKKSLSNSEIAGGFSFLTFFEHFYPGFSIFSKQTKKTPYPFWKVS